MEKALLWVTRQTFHLYGSEAISETEDKRPIIIIKDAPVALNTQKFQESWEPWARNPGQLPPIYMKIDFDHLNDQICFL